MRIAGIIAEYDPFHKGHAAHIEATRAENGGNASHVVVVMSGNFTQRGEPALVSKFRRAEMALAGGADLVLELPLPWAMAPAENFAAGGVAILNALGCVDLLSFGSECGNVEVLQQLADLPQNKDYQTALKRALASGVPYALAGQTVADDILGEEVATALSSPNNTLGIEYLRAIANQQADFEKFTLLRQGALHNQEVPNQGFAAASLLRNWIRDEQVDKALEFMPSATGEQLKQSVENGESPSNSHILHNALLTTLRKMRAVDFADLPWISEGLENRLYALSRTATDYDDLLTALKTRRYPLARLRRVLWSALIGITAKDTEELPPYIRVLGMNRRGREILSVASPTLPILTRTAQLEDLDDRARRIFDLECVATDLHALTRPVPDPCGTDHTQKLLIMQ